MRYEYQPKLVEQAVFLAARRDSYLECDLHGELDLLYSIPDGEIRNRGFQGVYTGYFKRLGFDRLIPKLIAERPLITNGVGLCVVHEAERARAQSAELFVKKQTGTSDRPACTLVIRVCAESLLDSARLDSWLRCELLPVSDMIDTAFGYSPDLPKGDPARQTLIRDRYSVLWSIYVETRLLREGRADGSRIPSLWKSFSRSMVQQGYVPPRSTFDELLQMDDTTHEQLMAWASEPASLETPCPLPIGHCLTSARLGRMRNTSVAEAEPIVSHGDGKEPYDP